MTGLLGPDGLCVIPPRWLYPDERRTLVLNDRGQALAACTTEAAALAARRLLASGGPRKTKTNP